MVKVIDGNLLSAKEEIIGHQVNCRGVMGSGVADQVKRKFPQAYKEYKLLCDVKGSKNLGTCQIVKIEDKTVANLFGQDGYGYGQVHTNLTALRECLEHLYSYAKECGKSVALPYKLGSDRGGADWNEVVEIIESIFDDSVTLTLYRYRPNNYGHFVADAVFGRG